MFGKFFASTFTGSMMGAGPAVFAVWSYVIANTEVDGFVELNPKLLAAIIGAPIEEMQAAIDKLCAPDPNSRNPEEEGRRLVKEGTFRYRVVSHAIYRALRNEEERRAYNREKQRESRKRRRVNNVNDIQTCVPRSAHAEADAEVEADPESEMTTTTRGGWSVPGTSSGGGRTAVPPRKPWRQPIPEGQDIP